MGAVKSDLELSHPSKYGIKCRFKLDRASARDLEAYLDHLGISLNTFVRKLVKKELLDRTMADEKGAS